MIGEIPTMFAQKNLMFHYPVGHERLL